MKRVTLGETGIRVPQTGFGALPIQRVPMDEAVRILKAARDGGIEFFDTARAYSDSEEKLGRAFGGAWDGLTIATKTGARDAATFRGHLEQSLRLLKTDCIDIYQFHNPSEIPVPGGAGGLYEAALDAKARGEIKHIGITLHSIEKAREAALSGLYETIQYPFNHLASPMDVELVELCARLKMGFIAMKALSGGLITNARAPFAYLSQFDHVVPIWGVQRMSELEEFISLSNDPPVLDEDVLSQIESDRQELTGAFCRGCGYCQPCPAGIPIQMANRMLLLIRRAPSEPFFSGEWRANMEKIKDCTRCGACEKRCPYGLKPYEMLPAQLEGYLGMTPP